MAARKPRPLTTQDQLLRRLPGYKGPVAKAEIGAEATGKAKLNVQVNLKLKLKLTLS